MPRPIIGLDERKDDIERWIVHDGVKIIDVVARLKNDYNINIQKRTLERNLQAWGLTTRSRMSKAALQQELTRLFRGPHMTDQEICKSLNDQGHVINPRTVMDTRKRMGLHKRIRHDTKEEDLQATIRQLLQVEYQDEAVLKMERSELYTYLKTKYPEHHITGRDRVYCIAREMNPYAKRRFHKGHPLHQNRPYKLSGKRKAAKEAAMAAAAAADLGTEAAVDMNSAQDHHPDESSLPLASADDQPAPMGDCQLSKSQLPVIRDSTMHVAVPETTDDEVLDPILRVQGLEREKIALQEKLHQQDAEIQHMRQAYLELMSRLPPQTRFSTQ